MRKTFEWNPFADQPHNVASRTERFRQHFRYTGSYFSLFFANMRKLIPGVSRFRKYRKRMFQEPVDMDHPFGLSVSPIEGRNEEVLEGLLKTGIHHALVRIPSWEENRLPFFGEFIDLLHHNRIDLTLALLQRRDDVLNPSRWEAFIDDVFGRFKEKCSFFEIGHAWNRTKWGVWDYKEYLKLARPACMLGQKHGVKLVGPAVIDFEFHLYPPVLREIPFDKVSSLLYVDRVGAPENKQFGWNTAAKIALLKAVVDVCSRESRDLWITEFNWPLEGTGKYSPASGKPNVTEEEQADFLVRYCVLTSASGFVERLYWWQLIAPGYGLIDNRGNGWRKRPSFFAFKTLVGLLDGRTFASKIPHPQAEIFVFTKEGENLAVCWTAGQGFTLDFSQRVIRVLSRNGEGIDITENRIDVTGSPKYVFYKDE
ncbi:MAG: hypothetical protein JXB23_05175 [Candidatus Aminicenantes bacterium]|nr:hypothetical protein [Candidatus Aminicenantes bacterium]